LDFEAKIFVVIKRAERWGEIYNREIPFPLFNFEIEIVLSFHEEFKLINHDSNSDWVA